MFGLLVEAPCNDFSCVYMRDDAEEVGLHEQLRARSYELLFTSESLLRNTNTHSRDKQVTESLHVKNTRITLYIFRFLPFPQSLTELSRVFTSSNSQTHSTEAEMLLSGVKTNCTEICKLHTTTHDGVSHGDRVLKPKQSASCLERTWRTVWAWRRSPNQKHVKVLDVDMEQAVRQRQLQTARAALHSHLHYIQSVLQFIS